MTGYIDTRSITHIMSIDLQDNLALVTKTAGIKYVSVVWDAPYYPLYSPYNFYDEFMTNAPSVLQDYFISIYEEAAFKWDGLDRVYGKTDSEILEYMRRAVPGLQFGNFFEIEDTEFFEGAFLIRKIANKERIGILNLLAENYHMTLYTNSKTAKDVVARCRDLSARQSDKRSV